LDNTMCVFGPFMQVMVSYLNKDSEEFREIHSKVIFTLYLLHMFHNKSCNQTYN